MGFVYDVIAEFAGKVFVVAAKGIHGADLAALGVVSGVQTSREGAQVLLVNGVVVRAGHSLVFLTVNF